MKKINTVFLIDDDPIHQQIAKRMIERQQVTKKIVSFLEADLALNYIREQLYQPEFLPDLILLDINMPVMDGWDFLEAFESFRENIPKRILIYILTSSVNESDMVKAKTYASLDGYLVKPLTTETIEHLLK